MSSPTRSLLLLLQADTTSATTLDDHGYAADEGASANAEYNMFNPTQAYTEYPDAGMGGDVYDTGYEGYGFAADDDESSAYFLSLIHLRSRRRIDRVVYAGDRVP